MIKKTLIQFFADEHISPIDDKIPTTTETQEYSIEDNPTSEHSKVEQKNEETQDKPNYIEETKIPPKEKIMNPPTNPELLQVYQECLNCKQCELCESALNLVFGDGNPNADLMLIGEAPGADEDEQGVPFIGRAGKLLISILNKYGVQREDIFIANILKHRPPNNRNPLPVEIQACTPFLQKQIAIIKPKLLITLGNFSSQYILDTKVGITKIRGTIQESSFGQVMPSLHPSAIIRGAYPKHLLEGDIVTALQYIGLDVQLKED